MSFSQLGVLALIVYLAGMLIVAEIARRARRDESPSDHFLAGRQLGVFVLFMALVGAAITLVAAFLLTGARF